MFQPTGFKLPKQNDEELPVGEEGHTSAPAHTRDRMGEFPSVAFWNWSQPSTDWFNLATGEALAEYNPSPVMRELVAGVESQRADPHLSASTGGIAHITHSTTSNSRVNATQPRETRSSTRVTRSSTLIYARNSRPTTSNSRANTSKTHQSTHADANEKSTRKFGDRNCGDGMDGRFDDGMLAGSMTGSVTEIQLVKMRAAPVRGARTPCPLT